MTPLFWYGLRIIDAHSPSGYQYGEFEIDTDAYGGFEHYKWQSGGSNAKLWRVDGHDSKTLIATGHDVPAALSLLLQRAHTTEPRKLNYREFQILVDGWVEGKGRK